MKDNLSDNLQICGMEEIRIMYFDHECNTIMMFIAIKNNVVFAMESMIYECAT